MLTWMYLLADSKNDGRNSNTVVVELGSCNAVELNSHSSSNEAVFSTYIRSFPVEIFTNRHSEDTLKNLVDTATLINLGLFYVLYVAGHHQVPSKSRWTPRKTTRDLPSKWE